MTSFCEVKRANKKEYFKNEAALKQVGNKIREIRISKKISIEALADTCELDYSQINRMELGKVNFGISFLFRVANALEVDPKDLL